MAKYTGAFLVLILSCAGVTTSTVKSAGAPLIGKIAAADERMVLGTAQGAALPNFDPKFDIAPDGSAGLVPHILLNSDSAVVGIASFYEGAQTTSSGELYDPGEFTAAAQLEIRDLFGGIRYGKNYQPCYAIGEFAGKKIIVKFNDVGPLKPGRKFDLSRAAMTYFDADLAVGLLPEFRMTPLPLGQEYRTGPVTDEDLVAMGIAYGDEAVVTAAAAIAGSDIETPAVTPEAMERDDALQESRAYIAPEEHAMTAIVPTIDGVEAAVSAFDGTLEGIGERFLRLSDLIEAGRRLVALVGGGTPAGRQESVRVTQRRDGKAEEGLADVSHRASLAL